MSWCFGSDVCLCSSTPVPYSLTEIQPSSQVVVWWLQEQQAELQAEITFGDVFLRAGYYAHETCIQLLGNEGRRDCENVCQRNDGFRIALKCCHLVSFICFGG